MMFQNKPEVWKSLIGKKCLFSENSIKPQHEEDGWDIIREVDFENNYLKVESFHCVGHEKYSGSRLFYVALTSIVRIEQSDLDALGYSVLVLEEV